MNKTEAIFSELLEAVGCHEVLAARYPAPYKPYDLQPIRVTDNNEKNRQRRPMTPIPDFHPHPVEKHEYWDWMSERVMERWQSLKDKAQEREEQRKEQREEVIRQAEEAWGDTPMITLRGIHKAELKEADDEKEEQTAEGRVSNERESVEPFNADVVRAHAWRDVSVSRLLLDLMKELQHSRKLSVIPNLEGRASFDAAARQVFALRSKFKRVMIFESHVRVADGSFGVVYPDTNFSDHITECLRHSPKARSIWIKLQKRLAELEDD